MDRSECEQLIRSNRVVIAGWTIEEIAEALRVRIPVARKCGVRCRGELLDSHECCTFVGTVARAEHFSEGEQRVKPKCGEFDGLPHTRRHHVVADLRVHPRELKTFLARAHESVGVDHDSMARSSHEALNNREKRWQHAIKPRIVA